MKVRPARDYLPANAQAAAHPPTTWSGWLLHFARWAGRGLWSLTLTVARSPFWPWLGRFVQDKLSEVAARLR